MFTDFATSEFLSEPESDLHVPFVPTDEKVVQAMLELGGVSANDLLYDLGSGDGRIVVAAAKERGARAIGIDMDPLRVAEAREYAGWTGVEDLVEFIEDDLFCADFSAASVVTLYLLQTVNLELRPRLLKELRPGTRIVSHDFDMGSWKPDEKISAGGTNIYLWIVPAAIAGVWRWQTTDGRQHRVELQQEFQAISGKAWIDGEPAQLQAAELRGSRLQLTIQEHAAAPPETFIARYVNGELVPIAGSTSTFAAAMVAER